MVEGIQAVGGGGEGGEEGEGRGTQRVDEQALGIPPC